MKPQYGSRRGATVRRKTAAASASLLVVRASRRVRDLIDRGAAAVHKSRGDFILEASVMAAQNALLDRTHFMLSPTQMAEFGRIMSEPLSCNQRMKDLLASRAPWEP